MCIHQLIMGIHNSVMDIPLEVIFALGFSYQYVFIMAFQWVHDANNVIYVETMLNLTSTDWKEREKSREEIFYQIKVVVFC